MKDGNREKRKKIRTRRLWLDRLCINRRATRRKNKQSNVNETLNEGCLAMGEKISEFQVGIEPTSSGDAAGILQPWSFKNSFNDIIHSRIHSTPCYLSCERNCLQSKHIARNKKKRKQNDGVFFSLHQNAHEIPAFFWVDTYRPPTSKFKIQRNYAQSIPIVGLTFVIAWQSFHQK